MGIFNALYNAVSGLRAQSLALENISSNVANSQTIGHKRIDTSFRDLVAHNLNTGLNGTGGSVNALSLATNSVQGVIQSSDQGTHISVNGSGYFIVERKTGESDSRAIFAGNDLFTRRGDFTFDRDGYLVNGSGYFLKTLRLDPETGNPVGSVPEVFQVDNSFSNAIKTSEIVYNANLPATPFVSDFDENDETSWLLPTGLAGGDITRIDSDVFLDKSLSGGSITSYTENGQAVNIQLRWAKTANENPSATPPTSDTWELFYLSDSDPATDATVAWSRVAEYSFNSDGTINQIDSVAVTNGVVNIANLTIDGVTLGAVNLNHGLNGLTQFDDQNGVINPTAVEQNGQTAGSLINVTVSEDGDLRAFYSNGQTIDVARVVLATFNADNKLQRLDGGTFEQTSESGDPVIRPAGQVVGSSLEGSNADIADEFAKMIVTQQAYTANTRIVTTSDEMLQETLNMIR